MIGPAPRTATALTGFTGLTGLLVPRLGGTIPHSRGADHPVNPVNPVNALDLPDPDPREAKLRGAARQLTGVFAQQLFKAMRETVPQGEGAVSGGSGEEMFTGMLDEHLSGADAHSPAGAAFTRGLAEAVYRRLRAHAGAADAPTAPMAPAVTAAPAAASLLQPPRR